MIIAAIIAILIGGAVYMIMQRGMVRLIVGITLLSHGVNLLILATGIGAWRMEPLLDRTTPAEAADPLPQAFVLTAIVISMASTSVMVVLAALGRDDDTRSAESPERIARKLRALHTIGRADERNSRPNDELIRLKESSRARASALSNALSSRIASARNARGSTAHSGSTSTHSARAAQGAPNSRNTSTPAERGSSARGNQRKGEPRP